MAKKQRPEMIDPFDCISSLDYRYSTPEAVEYLSENAFNRYKLEVECALVRVLCERGICSPELRDEIITACKEVKTKDVYSEEDRIGHDVRAMVNCIQKRVSDDAKPFVHMTATSYDIVDTANSARFRDFTIKALIPAMVELERVLIRRTEEEAGTPQIGRSHGQHGVPITFGFALAGFVNRLGDCIVNMQVHADRLVGKFSGAMGAYNASSLFFDDPRQFERDVVRKLGLEVSRHSTQIAQPEPLARLLTEVGLTSGVLANLARNMRNLQRTEIQEVSEDFGEDQVGSSTMAHKKNPINLENVEGMWKTILTRMSLVFMELVSEHERDLTGSVPSRTYSEIFAYLFSAVQRTTRVMDKLHVMRKRMLENIGITKKLILAEPLYILLAAHGHSDAHEKSRQLSMDAANRDCDLVQVAMDDPEFMEYMGKFNQAQCDTLSDPLEYIGKAEACARDVATEWKMKLAL